MYSSIQDCFMTQIKKPAGAGSCFFPKLVQLKTCNFQAGWWKFINSVTLQDVSECILIRNQQKPSNQMPVYGTLTFGIL